MAFLSAVIGQKYLITLPNSSRLIRYIGYLAKESKF